MFETIDANSQSATNFIRPMRVRDDRKFVRVRFINDRFCFFQRHLILVDHLDDVDAGIRDFFDLGARIGRAFHTPAIKFFARIRFVLKKWTGDVKRWSRNFAAIDAIAHVDAVLQRTAEIACARYSGHEQLMRSRRHDFGSEPLFVSLVPMRVIAVTKNHRVNVAIPEARQHAHSLGGNNFGIARHW